MSERPCNERKEAAQILVKVLYEGAYSSVLLQKTFQAHPEWDGRQRALITNLVYTVLTHTLRLESMVNLYSRTPMRRMKPYIAVVLMMSAAQLLWMKKIPPSAVVDEAVKLVLASPWKGLSGFVNGVLRSMLRAELRESWPEAGEDLLAHLSVRYSIPRWILELWERSYGMERTRELAKTMSLPRCLSVRANTCRIAPSDLASRLALRVGEENVRTGLYCPEALQIKTPGDLSGWPEFRGGLMTVQDESSMFCAHALAPQPGEKVLDLCAAPGGKSTHLAQIMKNTGLVEARDVHESKVRLIQENAARLGLSIVRAVPGDALVARPEDRGAWDRVLLDAPCSGLGILRNKPDLKLHRQPQDIEELAGLQSRMLENAAKCVRTGGTLVYSTCTLNPAENEENVRQFLQRHPEFQAVSLQGSLPGNPGGAGAEYTYIWPEAEGLDGFFIVKLCKKR